MERVAPHLQRAHTRLSNVWLQTDSQGRKFLIDSGHSAERLILLADLWRAGIRGKGDLTAVLLTHRHSDHAGNAAFVRKMFGARVICHSDDAAILSGRKGAGELARGNAPFYKEWLCRAEDRHPAFAEVDETYDDSRGRWGFRAYHVPGRTEGSVMLWHEETRTLYTGDSILVGSSLKRGSKDLRLGDPDLCVEPESLKRSVRKFLEVLPPTEWLCPGHGPAVSEGAEKKLQKLLKSTRALNSAS